jgi:hypothetical protein
MMMVVVLLVVVSSSALRDGVARRAGWSAAA